MCEKCEGNSRGVIFSNMLTNLFERWRAKKTLNKDCQESESDKPDGDGQTGDG